MPAAVALPRLPPKSRLIAPARYEYGPESETPPASPASPASIGSRGPVCSPAPRRQTVLAAMPPTSTRLRPFSPSLSLSTPPATLRFRRTEETARCVPPPRCSKAHKLHKIRRRPEVECLAQQRRSQRKQAHHPERKACQQRPRIARSPARSSPDFALLFGINVQRIRFRRRQSALLRRLAQKQNVRHQQHRQRAGCGEKHAAPSHAVRHQLAHHPAAARIAEQEAQAQHRHHRAISGVGKPARRNLHQPHPSRRLKQAVAHPRQRKQRESRR